MGTRLRGDALNLDKTTLPTAGADGEIRLDAADDTLKRYDEALALWISLGGSGSGGGLVWNQVQGSAPIDAEENSNLVYLYAVAQTQQLAVWLKVPDNYNAGSQIQAKLAFYSPSAVNVWETRLVSTLIRKNTDAVDSVGNQTTSDSGDLTNTVANQYREITLDISDASGEINSVAVSGGDLIKCQLSRIVPLGSDDAADLRFVPTATEVTFG